MKYYRYLFFAAIALLPSLALADNIFQASPDDLSIRYLSLVFGNVEGTDVAGTGFQTLKVVLTSFNLAIMGLGGIVVLYSMVVSLINTAHDGEMLGKEWSSIWIPLRTALGFALLLPVKGSTSYAVIQVFIMWVVTQGVYAADYIWSKTIDNILAGGANPTFNAEQTNASVITLAQSIFVSLICAKEAAVDLNTTVGSIGPVEIGIDSNQQSILEYVFSLNGDYSPINVCGSVPYNTPLDQDSPQTLALKQAQNNSVVEMIRYLEPSADSFIREYQEYGSISSASSQIFQAAVATAADKYTYNMSLAASESNSQQTSNQLLNAYKKAGWITAGSSFLALMTASEVTTSAVVDAPTAKSWDMITGSNNSPAILNYVSDSSSFSAELNEARAESLPEDMVLTNPQQIEDFIESQLGPIKEMFAKLLLTWESSFLNITGNDQGTFSMPNPVLTIMNFGIRLTQYTALAYSLLTLTVSALGGIAYGAGQSIFGGLLGVGWGALLTMLNFITAPIMALFGALFGVGVLWGFYVPLIPFIVFTMGAIGWIILVIEAMVAAPLMAIGVLHPEGKHTVFGEAHAGIMLIAGVFLRPSLMIIGLVAALIMSYVVVIMITVGFTPVGISLSKSIIGLISMMIFFTMFVLIGINKAFSLIHILPDRVMRWIGQGEGHSSADQELNEIKGGAGSIDKGVGDSITSAKQGASQIQSQATANYRIKQDRQKNTASGLKDGGAIQAD